MKNIAILGSTGSIGTQTLDIIAQYPELFHAEVLVAGRNVDLLARQAIEHRPSIAVIADETLLPQLRARLSGSGIICEAGREAVEAAGCLPKVDIVVGSMVGYSGLAPTLNAIRTGKTIALANKETLVAAGRLMTSEARRHGVEILPVDSEHSAIFQCLRGERTAEASRIFLTASGGPFRTFTAEQIRHATLDQALCHPNWKMGAKVTIASASMMNKGLEMIEARWLFDCPPELIQVVVHPQSIVHSMVEFRDGSVKAQLGLTDMHLPIRYALGYPERLADQGRRLEISDFANLTFEEPDLERFPLLGIAYEAIAIGGTAPCVVNAANEVAVAALLDRRISFCQMPDIVARTLAAFGSGGEGSDESLDSIMKANDEAKSFASSLIS